MADIIKLPPICNLVGILGCSVPSGEQGKVCGNRIVAAHGDGSLGSINISNRTYVSGPFDKLVALLSLGHQVDDCSLVIEESPFSRRDYRPPSRAGGSEDELFRRYQLEVSSDGVVSLHGDCRCRRVDIGNGVHIARPVDKVVALFSRSRQGNYCAAVIGKSILARRGHLATICAIHCKVVAQPSKIGDYTLRLIHSDGGYGRVRVGDVGAGTLNELLTLVRHSLQRDYCSIGESPTTGDDHPTASTTGGGEIPFNAAAAAGTTITACYPANQC